MTRPFPIFSRSWLRAITVLTGCVCSIASGLAAGEVASETKTSTPPSESRLAAYLEKILPTAWQKRPVVQYNVITDTTPEGKKARVPSPETPMYYFANPARFALTGWSKEAGDKPMPSADLEEAMRKALAGNGYLPATVAHPPEIMLFLAYGTHATDPTALASVDEDSGAHTSDELLKFVVRDPMLFRDIVERARFVAGDKFADGLKAAINDEVRNMEGNAATGRLGSGTGVQLPVSPDFGSPFLTFVRTGNSERMQHFAEMAFHTCYYVMASAYDFRGVEKGEKILLWRTRMTIEADGLAMNEMFKPLIANTALYLGRETPEAVMVEKQFVRGSKVEIGTASVVEDKKPAAAAAPKNSGTP